MEELSSLFGASWRRGCVMNVWKVVVKLHASLADRLARHFTGLTVFSSSELHRWGFWELGGQRVACWNMKNQKASHQKRCLFCSAYSRCLCSVFRRFSKLYIFSYLVWVQKQAPKKSKILKIRFFFSLNKETNFLIEWEKYLNSKVRKKI